MGLVSLSDWFLPLLIAKIVALIPSIFMIEAAQVEKGFIFLRSTSPLYLQKCLFVYLFHSFPFIRFYVFK